MMLGWPYCLSWFRIFSRMKGPSWVAKRKTSGQVLSTVERPNEEVSIGVMALAKRVGRTQLRVSELKSEFKAVVEENVEITSIGRFGAGRSGRGGEAEILTHNEAWFVLG